MGKSLEQCNSSYFCFSSKTSSTLRLSLFYTVNKGCDNKSMLSIIIALINLVAAHFYCAA